MSYYEVSTYSSALRLRGDTELQSPLRNRYIYIVLLPDPLSMTRRALEREDPSPSGGHGDIPAQLAQHARGLLATVSMGFPLTHTLLGVSKAPRGVHVRCFEKHRVVAARWVQPA